MPIQRIDRLIDPENDMLDQLADLCEYWKKWRAQGITPIFIATAIRTLAQGLAEPQPTAMAELLFDIDDSKRS